MSGFDVSIQSKEFVEITESITVKIRSGKGIDHINLCPIDQESIFVQQFRGNNIKVDYAIHVHIFRVSLFERFYLFLELISLLWRHSSLGKVISKSHGSNERNIKLRLTIDWIGRQTRGGNVDHKIERLDILVELVKRVVKRLVFNHIEKLSESVDPKNCDMLFDTQNKDNELLINYFLEPILFHEIIVGKSSAFLLFNFMILIDCFNSIVIDGTYLLK